jgi:squalene-hopene/tetraprenyl-beta-curcumene cyclase
MDEIKKNPVSNAVAAEGAKPRFGRMDIGPEQVDSTIQSAADYLLGLQTEEGYWCGELEADVMLEADYIFMHVLLGTGDSGKLERAANEILRHQNEDGGWSLYPGGPSNVNYGVKAYLALKLMGYKAEDAVMVRARECTLKLGGVTECNTFTKIYLCSMGQYDYDAVPAVPPEIILFPNWFYFNIYQISAWSRAILVPLSIIYAKKPFKKLAPEQGIDELFVGGREKAKLHLKWDKKHLISWRNVFLLADRMTHWFELIHIRPLRRLALKRAEEWMLLHFERSDGLGAISLKSWGLIVRMVSRRTRLRRFGCSLVFLLCGTRRRCCRLLVELGCRGRTRVW